MRNYIPSVKVTDCTSRWCCDEKKDLVHTDGKPSRCRHCGQRWELEGFIDAAGSRDYHWVRVNTPEHVCGLSGYNPGPPNFDPICPACWDRCWG